jgi:DNA gyrase subunit A
VGALMVRPDDEIFAITSAGGVIRTRAGGVKQSGRQTMGVRLMNLAAGDSVVGLARNAESLAEGDDQGLSEGFPNDAADLTDEAGAVDAPGSGDEEEPEEEPEAE